MLRTTLLTVLLLSFVPLSEAADNGVYLGVGYAQSEYDLDNPLDAEPFDDEDSGYKLIVGFRPLDSFGVELNYIDHGDATIPNSACVPNVGIACPAIVESIRAGAETISGFAVGFLDFPLIDLFAKVGASSWQFDGSAGQDFDFDESDVDFAWGAGVQAHFGSLGARLEYERFKIVEDQDLGTISLSFIYTFL